MTIPPLAHAGMRCRAVGIGPLISTAIVAAIGKGEVFDRGRDFAAWLGLVPRQLSTGRRTILGRISKRGNSYLRMLLVQAANVILMRPHRWDAIGLGPWLRGVVSRMPHNKAAVALANKLARIAWSVLRHGKIYTVVGDETLKQFLINLNRLTLPEIKDFNALDDVGCLK